MSSRLATKFCILSISSQETRSAGKENIVLNFGMDAEHRSNFEEDKNQKELFNN